MLAFSRTSLASFAVRQPPSLSGGGIITGMRRGRDKEIRTEKCGWEFHLRKRKALQEGAFIA